MRFVVSALFGIVAATQLRAECTLQLSEQGVVRMKSGEQRTVTWNAVPGATSYYVEDLIEGLGDPGLPDFTFGGPYTESRNGEGRGITSYPFGHKVLYKMTFHFFVTALNRGDASFQPCKADFRYVVEADQELASVASRRIVPLAGKTPGMNGANYSTALIINGIRLAGFETLVPGFYQGRIYFRPLGTRASDDDPSIPFELTGTETMVIDDVMKQLGATGIGTIEVIPRVGFPTPQVDAIIDNHLPDGKRTGARITAAWGRDYLLTSDTVTVGIRNNADTRISIGVRGYGDLGGFLSFQHLSSDGTILENVHDNLQGNTTALFPLASLFKQPLKAADRVIVHYMGMEFDSSPDGLRLFSGGKGVILFVTETGNDLNNPNVIYRDSTDTPHFSQGFDRFLVR